MNRFGSFLAFACTVAFAVAILAIVQVSNQRRETINSKLERQHEICVQVSGVRQILHNEHVPKLVQAQKNVRRYPHGVSIPTSNGRLHVSHAELIRTRNAEAKIVQDTKRKPC